MIDRFLCAAATRRACETFRKLSRHDISGWALAGGLAVEIHGLRAGLPASTRPLNDIDFVAAAFDCIPATLGADFLFRHVHPFDPPGKTILQCVDAGTALRVDLFRASEAVMARTLPWELPFAPIRLIALEDVLARTVRLLLDLRGGVPVAAKHANDYLRLERLMRSAGVEAAWRDHRKADHPVSFCEANDLARDLIRDRADLLITPAFSRDATRVCPRCVPAAGFPLADPDLVLSLLGYC